MPIKRMVRRVPGGADMEELRLKARIAALYEGKSEAAERFRYALHRLAFVGKQDDASALDRPLLGSAFPAPLP